MIRALLAFAAFAIALSLSGQAMAQTDRLFKGCDGPYTNGNPPQPQCTTPGFYAQQVEVMVPHIPGRTDQPDPSCNGTEGSSTIDWSQAIEDGLKAYYGDDAAAAKRLSGNLTNFLKSTTATTLKSNIRGDIGAAIQRNLGQVVQSASCNQLSAIVPVKADVKAFRLGDWDNVVGVGGCDTKLCANGWARFDFPPQTVKDTNMQMVTTNFKNWSHDRDRVASMTVFYIMPAGEPAPLERW